MAQKMAGKREKQFRMKLAAQYPRLTLQTYTLGRRGQIMKMSNSADANKLERVAPSLYVGM